MIFIRNVHANVVWDVEVRRVSLEVEGSDGGVKVEEATKKEMENVGTPDGLRERRVEGIVVLEGEEGKRAEVGVAACN